MDPSSTPPPMLDTHTLLETPPTADQHILELSTTNVRTKTHTHTHEHPLKDPQAAQHTLV